MNWQLWISVLNDWFLKLAKAIDYALSNWRALTRYLDDGNVPIDNNAAENAIRPLVVGRNNANFGFMRTRRRSPRE